MNGFEQKHSLSEGMDRAAFQARFGIIGRSLEMREIIDTVMQVAPTDITVLLTGESGTGKEVLAHAIHGGSKRADRKFIAVNCGAIPEGILESELFGHEKGSFTGAIETRKGYFELADGGTIFLDEIGDTPITTQVKLLRVLENGEFMRVGSSEQRRTDVRVIAATNKDLEQEVRAKHFRQDLYYRLRSVNIRIPPLRNRRSDIKLFVDTLLNDAQHAAPANRIMLTDDAMDALMRHSWPGNIRELKNTLESIAILEHGHVVDAAVISKYLPTHDPYESDRALPVSLGKSPEQAEREMIIGLLRGLWLQIEDLKRLVEQGQARSQLALPSGEANTVEISGVSYDELSLDEIEREVLQRVLARFDGSRRLAARSLKISERTLYRKIKEHGLG